MYNLGHDILRLLRPPVKRSVITSNKHGTYETPQELPNDLSLRISGNLERSRMYTMFNF